MTDTDPGEYAVIETFPPQEFHYYPNFYIMSSFFAVFLIGLILVVWVPLILAYIADGFLYGPMVRATAYLTATFLFLVLLGRLSRRELDKVCFTVSADGITRRDSYRKLSAAWHDITRVRCRKIPFAKGFVEITTPRNRIFLPSTITDFGTLGAGIRKGLERSGKGELCNDTFLRAMVTMGKVSESWNGRAKAAFWPLVAATILMVLFNSFVALFMWGMGEIPLIIWAGIGLPLPLLVYSIADIRCNRRLQKALLNGGEYNPARDLSSELLVGALIAAPLYGIFGIIARTIFHS
jgi:hypothetical protein